MQVRCQKDGMIDLSLLKCAFARSSRSEVHSSSHTIRSGSSASLLLQQPAVSTSTSILRFIGNLEPLMMMLTLSVVYVYSSALEYTCKLYISFNRIDFMRISHEIIP